MKNDTFCLPIEGLSFEERKLLREREERAVEEMMNKMKRDALLNPSFVQQMDELMSRKFWLDQHKAFESFIWGGNHN